MKKRQLIKISVISVSVLLLISLLVTGYFSFFRKKADENKKPKQYVANSVTVSFKNASGQTYSDQNTVKIRKVSEPQLVNKLQGRNANSTKNVSGQITIINPADYSELGSIDFNYKNDNPVIKWASVKNIDPDKSYDLKISIPGYLPKRFFDVNLGEIDELAAGTFLAGNIANSDVNVINWDDYAEWQKDYGKSVSSPNDPNFLKDFNGDGIINYFDFAIAFGSGNWQKTEQSQ